MSGFAAGSSLTIHGGMTKSRKTTIEDVLFLDSTHIGVLNDNNFPFSVGRHLGSGKPDDNEFIIIELGTALAQD